MTRRLQGGERKSCRENKTVYDLLHEPVSNSNAAQSLRAEICARQLLSNYFDGKRIIVRRCAGNAEGGFLDGGGWGVGSRCSRGDAEVSGLGTQGLEIEQHGANAVLLDSSVMTTQRGQVEGFRLRFTILNAWFE